MATRITINVAALDRFLTKVVQPYLATKATEIAAEARRTAPEGGTGELRNSIQVVNKARGGVSVEVNAPHAGFVEQGTGPQHRPGANAPYFPAVRRRGLIAWSGGNGSNPYAVAHGISLNGTPANPFLETAVQKVLGSLRFRWIKKDFG